MISDEQPWTDVTEPADTEPSPSQVTALPENTRATAADISRIFDRLPKGQDALKGELLKPRMAEFLFDGSCGLPGVFVDSEGNYMDVKITIRALSSAEEIEALSEVKKAIEAPYYLARAALYRIEGKPVTEEMRHFLWEALGQTGRQLCLMALQGIGGATGDAAMGKYQATFSVL